MNTHTRLPGHSAAIRAFSNYDAHVPSLLQAWAGPGAGHSSDPSATPTQNRGQLSSSAPASGPSGGRPGYPASPAQIVDGLVQGTSYAFWFLEDTSGTAAPTGNHASPRGRAAGPQPMQHTGDGDQSPRSPSRVGRADRTLPPSAGGSMGSWWDNAAGTPGVSRPAGGAVANPTYSGGSVPAASGAPDAVEQSEGLPAAVRRGLRPAVAWELPIDVPMGRGPPRRQMGEQCCMRMRW